MPQLSDVLLDSATNPTRIRLVKTASLDEHKGQLEKPDQARLKRQNFAATAEQFAWLEDEAGPLLLVGWDGADNLSTLGSLPWQLPEADYVLEDQVSPLQLLGWALGAYKFTRYKSSNREAARLVLPKDAPSVVRNAANAIALARDLINTPAADMAPSHLTAEVLAMATRYDAQCSITLGDELLDLGAGAIHAVGRAAEDPPCLADLTWGDPSHPAITLVGKGVTFDSGGLNLKPSSGMRQMKKDMGGAATAIGLADLIMAEALPIRLRLLVPMAENAIAGNAFRPGDILSTHKGLTVEIDNTDAEGRLLLCDALSVGSDAAPELIIDFATLTGSARSAVGTEIAAMFTNDDVVASGIEAAATTSDDDVWRMPLHKGYEHMIDSNIADLVNSAASPYAGSVTAALFLQKFVGDTPWVHFDIMAYNTRNRPARPEGGEAMALRAVFHYLEQRYVAS
ncbi:MAG: leucyl aminopeptidase [Limisphaerales bacterium]|jgi:leucyl aminopeptidase